MIGARTDEASESAPSDAATDGGAPSSAAPQATRVEGDDLAAPLVRRGRLVHGALDLVFAALYAWLGFAVAPGRGAGWNATLIAVIVLVAVAGVGLLVGARAGRLVAIAAHLVLLGFALVVGVLLVASAAYLRGVYGPIGKGLAVMSLVAAALVAEACLLLPLFQLRFLLRDDVRAAFARPRR